MLRVLGLSQRRSRCSLLARVRAGRPDRAASRACARVGRALRFVLLLAGLVDRPRCRRRAFWPALFGLGIGLTLLLGFGLPPVLQLAQRAAAARHPARRRRAAAGLDRGARRAARSASSRCCWRPRRDIKLGADRGRRLRRRPRALRAAGWVAVQVLRRAVPEARAPRWLVLATRQIAARPAFAVLQVVGAGVGLAGAGAAGAAAHRPDRRAGARRRRRMRRTASSSISSPSRARPSSSALRAGRHQAASTGIPMIRGRLVAINGKPVEPGRLRRRPRASAWSIASST